MEPALVDNVRGLLATLGDYVVGAEVVGGGFEVGEGEFRERRGAAGFWVGSGGDRLVVGLGPGGAVGLLMGRDFLRVRLRLRYTATHVLGIWFSLCALSSVDLKDKTRAKP